MTLLIKNVQLVDGVHEFPERSDVFVADGFVSAIGTFPNKRAHEVLDGQGSWLSPGFVDVNTNSDHYLTLFNCPSQEDFLRQGVTTIFGGMCGASLAPLLYGGLESLQAWDDASHMNVNWHTVRDFLGVLDRHPLAVNFGTFAGHGTIRRDVIHDVARDMTKNERAVFLRIFQGALRDGVFGLSTGLSYPQTRKTPESELLSFARAVRQGHGVYATHLRNTGVGIHESVGETIRLAEASGVKTLISHFVPEVGAEEDYKKAFGMIDALPATVDLRFDISPFSETLAPLYSFLPQWAQNGGMQAMLKNIKDEWFLSRIKKDMPEVGADAFVVAQASGNDILVGRSLRDLMTMFDAHDAQDAIVKLMLVTELRAIILHQNLDQNLIRKALVHPRSFIASHAPSFDESIAPLRLKTDRTKATFSRFLSLVEKESLMSLKDAVRKLSYEPARMLDLRGRGEIFAGAVADMVCFKGDEVRFTVVNGRVVFKNGQFQNIFPGKALRREKH
jgi:N-acyl-D-amino-acid deacylase